MTINGYALAGEWTNSTSGKIAHATKRGKKYFIKKYQTPVMPVDNGSVSAKTIEHNKALFNRFVDRHRKVNAAIRAKSGRGGNIIVPCEEFIDGNQFVEVSEFIENAVDKKTMPAVLARLSAEAKQLLMQTAAGAMEIVHSQRIVHSDLKIENVLLVKNSTGHYVAKIVDFDGAYFEGELPDEVVGTVEYFSPELAIYILREDDREELAHTLTTKSDIFALGVIFHYYLSGKFPTPANLPEKLKRKYDEGKPVHCWLALNSGGSIVLDPSITNPKYISLINAMLSKDPEDRPTAQEVLRRLREDLVIDDPWSDHSIAIDKTVLDRANVVGFKKIDDGSQKKYELTYKEGKCVTVTKDELISLGLAKLIVVGNAEPWPEHKITIDFDKLKTSFGYTASERAVLGGVKGYNFYRGSSSKRFLKRDDLLMMGCAKKDGDATPSPAPRVTPTPAPTPAPIEGEFECCEPWAEHKMEFDTEAIRLSGYLKVEQAILSGVKGYNFVNNKGKSRFIPSGTVLMMRLARRI